MADRLYNNIDVLPGGGAGGGGTLTVTKSSVGANVSSFQSNTLATIGPEATITATAGETITINWSGFVRQNQGIEFSSGVELGFRVVRVSNGSIIKDSTVTFMFAETANDRAVSFRAAYTVDLDGDYTIQLVAKRNVDGGSGNIIGFTIRDAQGIGSPTFTDPEPSFFVEQIG